MAAPPGTVGESAARQGRGHCSLREGTEARARGSHQHRAPAQPPGAPGAKGSSRNSQTRAWVPGILLWETPVGGGKGEPEVGLHWAVTGRARLWRCDTHTLCSVGVAHSPSHPGLPGRGRLPYVSRCPTPVPPWLTRTPCRWGEACWLQPPCPLVPAGTAGWERETSGLAPPPAHSNPAPQ